MSYRQRAIVEAVRSSLARNPRASLDSICLDLQLARHTVTRALKSQTGLSYREYQQRQLLAAAVALLGSSSPVSIKEIALELGYASPASFSRFIKRVTGSSPRDLRERAAERRGGVGEQ